MDPTEPTDRPALLEVERPDQRGSIPEDARDPIRVPGDPFGDSSTGALLSLRALLQVRYTTTFVKASTRTTPDGYAVRETWLGEKGDGPAIQRLFLRLGSDPSKYVGFKTILDFAELIGNNPEDVVKQSYITIRAIPERLELVAGYAKLPFSTTELDASAKLEFAAFGPTNRLVGDLGYAGSDLGLQVLGAPLRKPRYLTATLGLFRGHAQDEHDSPVGALGARLESKPKKALRIGADIVQHMRGVTYNRPFKTDDEDDFALNPADPRYPSARRWSKGHAMSGDVRFKKKGVMLRGEAVYGDRVDIETRYDARTFWGFWVLASYRIDLPRDVHLMPAFRFEQLDANREKATGLYRQYSYAVTLLAFERVRLLIDVSNTHVQKGSPALNQPKPISADPYYALPSTRMVGQIQIEL